MFKLVTLLAFILSTTVFASSTTLKQIDNIQNSSGGSSIAVPGTGSSFATDSNTLTLTNKTLSGASNTFSNIPASAISSGQLGVANGGTGDSSFTSNGVIYGAGSSPLAVTAAGSQYQTLQAGSGGTPQFAAVALNQSAAVSGTLANANGGTDNSSAPTDGQLLIGSSSTSKWVESTLTAGTNVTITNGHGSITISASGSAPSLNGGSGSPESITAGVGVTLSSISYVNEIWVAGSGGAVTVTATPSVSACTADGQQLKVHGTSNTNTVKLQDQSNLSSSGLILNGNVTLGNNQSIQLHCDVTQSAWVEDNRSN